VRPSEAAIRAVLDTVYDPCSITFGVPLNLADMGLLTGVDIGDDGSVVVRMRLTTPGCIEGIVKFTHEVETGVAQVVGVTSVKAEFDDSCSWSEEDICEDGRRQLEEGRRQMRRRLQVVGG
jgi:metal-sulfur cluster biosynthetic enzyme